MSKEDVDVEELARKLERRLDRARSEIDEASALLLEVLGDEEHRVPTPPDWMRTRLRLWRKVYERDGVVAADELHDIAREIGYDPRGLGGFFVGSESSLVHVGKDKVALRGWASDKVERYADWLEKRYPND